MFKKLVIASLILGSSTAFAVNGTPYVGADIGINHQMFDDKVLDSRIDFGDTGILINLNAGYGALVTQKIYVGGEVFASMTGSEVEGAKLNDDTFSLKFKTKYSYGASILPGVMLSNDTMLYARAGIIRTRFDVKEEASAIASNFIPTGSDENTVTGGQLGLGIKTKLVRNIDVRGEYAYSSYHSFSTMGNKINPSSGQATIGFVYNI